MFSRPRGTKHSAPRDHPSTPAMPENPQGPLSAPFLRATRPDLPCVYDDQPAWRQALDALGTEESAGDALWRIALTAARAPQAEGAGRGPSDDTVVLDVRRTMEVASAYYAPLASGKLGLPLQLLRHAGRQGIPSLLDTHFFHVGDSLDELERALLLGLRAHRSEGNVSFGLSALRAYGSPIQGVPGARAGGPARLLRLLASPQRALGGTLGATVAIDHPDLDPLLQLVGGLASQDLPSPHLSLLCSERFILGLDQGDPLHMTTMTWVAQAVEQGAEIDLLLEGRDQEGGCVALPGTGLLLPSGTSLSIPHIHLPCHLSTATLANPDTTGEGTHLDEEALRATVDTAIRLSYALAQVSAYPLPARAEEAPPPPCVVIALDGLAEMLVGLNQRYDLPTSKDITARVSRIVAERCAPEVLGPGAPRVYVIEGRDQEEAARAGLTTGLGALPSLLSGANGDLHPLFARRLATLPVAKRTRIASYVERVGSLIEYPAPEELAPELDVFLVEEEIAPEVFLWQRATFNTYAGGRELGRLSLRRGVSPSTQANTLVDHLLAEHTAGTWGVALLPARPMPSAGSAMSITRRQPTLAAPMPQPAPAPQASRGPVGEGESWLNESAPLHATPRPPGEGVIQIPAARLQEPNERPDDIGENQ